MIKQELDRIKERISNKDFLENKGLSNEVGIHVFCYKAEDELIVQDYIRRLKSEANTPYRIIECDLYEVFLSLLEDKRILKSVAGLEEKRGKKYLLDQLHLFEDIPIVMFYPGTFNGQTLNLFDEFKEGNYYRAFNLL